MHWYLIHTKPKQERIALQNLQQQGYVCYMPMFPCERVRRGSVSVGAEALFPRYLFIQLDTTLTSQSWSPIRSTKGVSRLVAFGSQPARVDASIVEYLRHQEGSMQGATRRLFNPGDSVQLTDRAFSGIEGIYLAPDGDSRALVLIELLSKQVRVGVHTAELRKIS